MEFAATNKVIGSNSSDFIYNGVPWDGNIKSKNSNHVLSVFFFNNDTVKNNNWDQIRTKYKILKREEITLSTLRANKFKIEF